jgi:sarcosine oxidase, subunit beta
MTDYDVIIIGAGSIGVPTAYFLSKEGKKVMVLDPNSASGQGQNKAAIGGTRATFSDPAKILTCKESLKVFSSWEHETGDDIGWKKGGYCFPVYRENEESVLKGILPMQKKFGLNIDWLEPSEIKKAVPGINPNGLIGGTLSPDDGQVSPLMATQSFTDQAKKLGAVFKYKERAVQMEKDGRRITAIKTNGGRYTADFFINTAGANATDVCKMAGVDVPVLPDSHEAGISAPVKHFLDPLVVDLRPGPEGRTANFYFGQNSEGRIIFCYTPKQIFPGYERECTSEFMPIIARRLCDLIPRFKNLLIRRLWRGLYPMTPDGVPVMDKAPGYDNFMLGIGMCGHGFMLGPGMAKNLTCLVVKGRPLLEPDVAKAWAADRDFYKAKKEALK